MYLLCNVQSDGHDYTRDKKNTVIKHKLRFKIIELYVSEYRLTVYLHYTIYREYR